MFIETLPKDPKETQIYIGSKIAEALQQNLLSLKSCDALLPCIRKMMDSRDQELMNCWSEVMLLSIQHMSVQLLETEVKFDYIVGVAGSFTEWRTCTTCPFQNLVC